MTGEVTYMPGSPDQLLEACKGKFDHVFVVGFDKAEFFTIQHSNIFSVTQVVGLLERIKYEILEKSQI